MPKIHNRIILLCNSFPGELPELHNFSAGSSAAFDKFHINSPKFPSPSCTSTTRSGIIKTADIWKKMPENRLIYRTQAIL